MFALTVITILTFISATYGGQDLDNAEYILECARQGLIDGVPDLGLPQMEPYFKLENLSWPDDPAIKADFYNLKISGIPHWTVFSAYQDNDDSDDTAIFKIYLTWANPVQFNGTYYIRSEEKNVSGDFSFTSEGNKWKGDVSFLKGKNVTNSEIYWSVSSVTTSIDGISDETADEISDAIIFFLESGYLGNFVGSGVKLLLEEWYPNKIDDLVSWCQNNTL